MANNLNQSEESIILTLNLRRLVIGQDVLQGLGKYLWVLGCSVTLHSAGLERPNLMRVLPVSELLHML